MVNDGSAVFVQVVGLAASGVGKLPAGNLTLVGRPAPFVVGPITTIGGGVAPFTDAFTASVSGGSNDTLVGAVFSFPGFLEVDATISGGNGTYLVNASYTFESPGTFPVSLHVTDDEFDVGVVSTAVFVAPGVPPALSAAVLNAPAYNGTRSNSRPSPPADPASTGTTGPSGTVPPPTGRTRSTCTPSPAPTPR